MAIVRWGSNPDEISDFDRLRQEVNRLFNVFSPASNTQNLPISPAQENPFNRLPDQV